jgi:hypothetical protein
MAQGIVPAMAAPSGRGWYFIFILSLLVLGWAYVRASSALSLFATVYLSGFVLLLLRYWVGELLVEYRGWQEQTQK